MSTQSRFAAASRALAARREPAPPPVLDRGRAPGIRLLPVLLVAVALLLTVKVGDVWTGLKDWRRAVRIADNAAIAASAPQPGDVKGEAKGADAKAADGLKTPDVAPSVQSATAELPRDPTRFRQSEIDLLQALAKRREQLEVRAHTLDGREELLQAAEKKLEEKAAALEAMKGELTRLIGERNAQEDARLKSLVKIYESMKPKEAATIMDKLDVSVVVGVVERMKESKAAQILAGMDPEKAKTVTDLLASRRDGPIRSADASGAKN